MAFTAVPKLETTAAGNSTGISMSMSVSPKGRRATVRITLNADAQKRLFNRALNPETDKVDVLIGRGVDEGHAKIVLNPNGAHQIRNSMKGSVSIRMARWDLLPEGKRPAGSVKPLGDAEIEGDKITALVLLPDWASPKKRERAAADAKRVNAGEARR
ncbi:hypothetical protein [Roseovarius nitratireducens]|uniref:hypothetical protein n=1 Tax=Roseovarius nitratireducens TaxID=2044597 RepID=UPI000CE1C43D|nr:hypothetical protein [Roseovarius nitratireducens]